MEEQSRAAVSGPARHTLRLFVAGVGAIALLSGVVVLVFGWGLGVDPLKNVMRGFSTMAPSTAFAIASLGLAVTLRARRPAARELAKAAAVVALAIGIATLLEYGFDWDLHFDRWWLSAQETPDLEKPPSRPAVATAVMLLLLGVAVLGGHRGYLRRVKSAAAFGALFIAWTVLNVYTLGASALADIAPIGSVAVHTAAVCLLLGLAALAAEPTSTAVRITLAKDTAGVVCRSLLPAAVLAPPTLGWALSHVAATGPQPAGLMWAIYSVSSSVGLVALILLLAQRIALIDAERTRATQLSLHDALTGVPNRRAFDSFLTDSLGLARRHAHALSLLMLDVDWFKSYNDSFGHPVGDELLKRVGSMLLELARDTDLVARVGGEEFAIVLPETDLEGARVFAERVRAEVESSRAFVRPISVSVGVASLMGRTVSASVLLDECDAALYEAKRAGRNRVSCWQGPVRASAQADPA